MQGKKNFKKLRNYFKKYVLGVLIRVTVGLILLLIQKLL